MLNVLNTRNKKITFEDGALKVPAFPILPYIEGDGIGADIWHGAVRVFNAAVAKAYGSSREIEWLEVYAGEKAYLRSNTWVPPETVQAFDDYVVGIKGPLTTPVGGGIRSINVALRQQLDLYACVRPIRYFPGVASPVKVPQDLNAVVFRENTEDLYAGIELKSGTIEGEAFKKFLSEQAPEGYRKLRFPDSASFGIKPVSKEGSERLIRCSLEYAIRNHRRVVTLVHKGNIMKYTEGAFRDWGYALAKNEFGAKEVGKGPWVNLPQDILVKDIIADAFFQEALLHPKSIDVVATLNLNGDFISDALAAQVGGVGIAPGANINYSTGRAIFEATHGTAPGLENQDRANPSSLILSGQMMLEYIGWNEAAELIGTALAKTLAEKTMTEDLANFVPGATAIKCSEFARRIVDAM